MTGPILMPALIAKRFNAKAILRCDGVTISVIKDKFAGRNDSFTAAKIKEAKSIK